MANKLQDIQKRWNQEIAIISQITAFIKENDNLLTLNPFVEKTLHRRINKGVSYVEVLEKEMTNEKLRCGLLKV